MPAHSRFLLALAFLGTVACGSSTPADTTARPAGNGWWCHGAEHAAFCARGVVECDALRVDTALDPGAHPCVEHPTAWCFTYRHPTLGEHFRCFDTVMHCEQQHTRCTLEETCSACDEWD